MMAPGLFNAYDAVPCSDPVNPAVAITLPVTCTVDPEAKIRLDREPFDVPFPTINADSADDTLLNCPCTCWYEPNAIVWRPSACE